MADRLEEGAGFVRFGVGDLAFAGRRVSPPSLYGAVWWMLAAVIVWLLAAIVWALAMPLSPLGDWRPEGPRIRTAAERAALYASVDPFNRTGGGASAGEGGAVTALALTLYGTRSTPGGQGSAIIAGSDGVQQVYRAGGEVMPGVTLVEVAFDHVVLSRNGARELLYLDQSGSAPTAQAVVAANPGAAAAAASPGGLTAETVRSGIAFAPRAEGGRVSGLEVQPGADGAAFRAAGFQPGDVITAVGGKPVASAGDGAALAGALRPGASVSVTVRRGDQTLPLAITVAP